LKTAHKGEQHFISQFPLALTCQRNRKHFGKVLHESTRKPREGAVRGTLHGLEWTLLATADPLVIVWVVWKVDQIGQTIGVR